MILAIDIKTQFDSLLILATESVVPRHQEKRMKSTKKERLMRNHFHEDSISKGWVDGYEIGLDLATPSIRTNVCGSFCQLFIYL